MTTQQREAARIRARRHRLLKVREDFEQRLAELEGSDDEVEQALAARLTAALNDAWGRW